MKKIIYAILIILGVAILGGVIWLMSIDGSYHTRRSIKIDAKKEQVYELISNYKTWGSWSPWLHAAPDAKTEITNEGIGIGAIYRWEGEIVGSGEIEHIELQENKSIKQQIRFKKPFESQAEVYWEFSDTEDGSEVTWGMKGEMPFLFKFMAKNIEPMIGRDYDRGLKMIKDLIEKGHISSNVTIEGVSSLEKFDYIAVGASGNMSEIKNLMKSNFDKNNQFIDEKNIDKKNLKVFSIYHEYERDRVVFSSGFSTDEDVEVSGDFYKGTYNKIDALKIVFRGDYNHLANAWSAGFHYLYASNLKLDPDADPIEIYVTNPEEEKDTDKWITEIYIPIKK